MNWFLIVVGALIGPIGFWGWRNTARLLSPYLSEKSRAHEEGVLQRGAGLLFLVGLAFVLVGLYQTFWG